jgi:hypothetical protein
LLLLETKFGRLSAEVRQRVEALSPEKLLPILLNLVRPNRSKSYS